MSVSSHSPFLALVCILAICNAYVHHVALMRARGNLSTFTLATSRALSSGTGGASLGSPETSSGTGIYTNSTSAPFPPSSSAISTSSFVTPTAFGSTSAALTTTTGLIDGTLSQSIGSASPFGASLSSIPTTLVTSAASASSGASRSGSGAPLTESNGPSSFGIGAAAPSLTSATATARAFPSGFSAVQFSDTAYTENTLVTTTLPGSSSPTIIPILVDHDGAFGLFGLTKFPKTVFPDLKFPGLPKFPSFSLPCLLFCGGGGGDGAGGVGAPITDPNKDPTQPDPSSSPSASDSSSAVSSTEVSSSISSAASSTGSTSTCSATGTATECSSALAYPVGTIDADPFPTDDVAAMTADAINILSGFYNFGANMTAAAAPTTLFNITIPNTLTASSPNTDAAVSSSVPSATSIPPTTSVLPTTSAPPTTSSPSPTTTPPPPTTTAPPATPTVPAVDPANTDSPECFPIPDGHIYDTHEGAVKEATSYFEANYAQTIMAAADGPVNVTQYLSHGVSSDPFDNNDQGDDQFLASILSVDGCVSDGYNLGEPLAGVKCEDIMYKCWKKCTGNKGRGGSITAGCLTYNFGTYIAS